jgi:uncharacterized membrane protein
MDNEVEEMKVRSMPIRTICKFVFGVLAFNLLSTAPAVTQPHSVIGVAENDVLNIRSDVAYTESVSNSKVIGTVPFNAVDVAVTGVSVDVKGAVWREISYNGTVGWVNARFLKPTSLYLETPKALSCGGTEPFWDVEIDEAGGSFSSQDVEAPIKLEYLRFAQGIGRTDLWAHYLNSTDGKYKLTTVVRYTEACSDGMSDFTYDFEVILLGMGATGAPAHGCCRLKY